MLLKQRFDNRAQQAREQKERENAEKCAVLQAEADKLRIRISAVHGPDTPLMMRSCKLSETDHVELDSLMVEDRFCKAAIDKDVAQGAKHVDRPHRAIEECLQAVQLPPEPAKPPALHWLPLVCQQREWFADAVFRVDEPGRPMYWKFVFATKTPCLLCLQRLSVVENIDTAMAACDFGGHHCL